MGFGLGLGLGLANPNPNPNPKPNPNPNQENVAALELLDGGHVKEAVRRLKQCIKQRPWEPEAYFNLGSVYIQKADRPKALQVRGHTG